MGTHRDLHSFPTRRSSDLGGYDVIPAHRDLAGAEVEMVELEHRESRLDRKSTRLNSSHRCISYAVFCLKKKNIEPDSQIATPTLSYLGNCSGHASASDAHS